MRNQMNQVWLRRSAIGASLAALVGVASWAFAAPSATKDVDHPKAYKEADVSEAKHKASELSRAFSHAADLVRPAVVSIQSAKTVKMDDGAAQGNDLLRRFFEEQPELRGKEPRRPHAPRSGEQQGLGSGFIVS